MSRRAASLLTCPFRHNQYSTALPSLKRYEVESSWTRKTRRWASPTDSTWGKADPQERLLSTLDHSPSGLAIQLRDF